MFENNSENTENTATQTAQWITLGLVCAASLAPVIHYYGRKAADKLHHLAQESGLIEKEISPQARAIQATLRAGQKKEEKAAPTPQLQQSFLSPHNSRTSDAYASWVHSTHNPDTLTRGIF